MTVAIPSSKTLHSSVIFAVRFMSGRRRKHLKTWFVITCAIATLLDHQS